MALILTIFSIFKMERRAYDNDLPFVGKRFNFICLASICARLFFFTSAVYVYIHVINGCSFIFALMNRN